MLVLQLLPPFEGNCMAGIYVAYLAWSNQVREYLSTELSETLSAGVEYIISCRLYRRITFDAAIDKIGFYFSEEAPFYKVHDMLPVEHQVELDTLITTTDEWVFVSRTYIAQGGERYLTFGNFRDHGEMNYQLMGLSWKKFEHAYYFFDDMRLTPRETAVNEAHKQNQFSWNGRLLSCEVHENTLCLVYDTRGRLMFTQNLVPSSTQLTVRSVNTGQNKGITTYVENGNFQNTGVESFATGGVVSTGATI